MAVPPDPLEHHRKLAKRLLRAVRAGDTEASSRVRKHHHKFTADSSFEKFCLADAQFVIAREHGFQSWSSMKSKSPLLKEPTMIASQTEVVPPTAQYKAGIRAAALGFPMDHIIKRYRKDFDVEESVASIHEHEIRRYLYLSATHPGERWPMVASVDKLWHTFLLFTRDYQRFCNSLGVPFLHHEPFADETDHSRVAEAYARFLSCYRAEFGEPLASIWPAQIGTTSDCTDCEQQCEGQCAASG